MPMCDLPGLQGRLGGVLREGRSGARSGASCARQSRPCDPGRPHYAGHRWARPKRES